MDGAITLPMKSLLFAIALGAVGCGEAVRSVVDGDVVGRFELHESYGDVELVFMADGRFAQVVTVPGKAVRQEGRWTLKRSPEWFDDRLWLEPCLAVEGGNCRLRESFATPVDGCSWPIGKTLGGRTRITSGDDCGTYWKE
jgi:hypothetical protein